jgi:hypothetical protein
MRTPADSATAQACRIDPRGRSRCRWRSQGPVTSQVYELLQPCVATSMLCVEEHRLALNATMISPPSSSIQAISCHSDSRHIYEVTWSRWQVAARTPRVEPPLREVSGGAEAFWAEILSKAEGEISRGDVLTGLRLEHLELLALFESHARIKVLSIRGALLKVICKRTRLHYLIETGVFFAALAEVPGTSRLLDRAGEEYANAIPLLNELIDPDNDLQLSESQILELRAVVERHVCSTESTQGAFAASMHANVDWDVLARKLIARRKRLAGEAWRKS